MDQHEPIRKLTAILSADVKGYSRLMGEDDVATVRTLTAYREGKGWRTSSRAAMRIDVLQGDDLTAKAAKLRNGTE